ncbi:hypothetical protein D1AOALGA4SA_9589 [Olavius algarvensis Delta 1 endosymbiont]|nr:hypothetical protein D1AOALGA4SA_9589 [Olavius algarvensis Delta 1 endosymbiont]
MSRNIAIFNIYHLGCRIHLRGTEYRQMVIDIMILSVFDR